VIQQNLHYGRRKPKNSPAIPLRAILRTTEIPPHPAMVDYLQRLFAWLMLGNNIAGDCVAVTWANVRRLVTYVLGGVESYPTIDQVWQLYKTQNPDFDPNGGSNGPGSNADGGMVIQTVLEHLVKNGGPDGVKAVAFAKVDHTNFDEVKAAIAIFGYVWVGVDVSAANERQFPNQPWDHVPGSPNEGGHSIIAGGYLGKPTADMTFITWAQEQYFTDSFWANQVEEAWVVIWPEHLGTASFDAGIDAEALADAYTAITSRPFPAPIPAPQPAPPAPVEDGLTINVNDQQVTEHLTHVSRSAGLDAWAEHHFRSYFNIK
jgi:hypothetical protein